MSLRLPLSGYLLVLSGFQIAQGLPDAVLSYAALVIGMLLVLTVILDHLYFKQR
jgi:hypothetical protein